MKTKSKFILSVIVLFIGLSLAVISAYIAFGLAPAVGIAGVFITMTGAAIMASL